MKFLICECCNEEKKVKDCLSAINVSGTIRVFCKDCKQEKNPKMLEVLDSNAETPEQNKEYIEQFKMEKEHVMNQFYPVAVEQIDSSNNNLFINLNEKVKSNFNPVLFREDELQRIVQILCRKSKCNAALIGEAGIGKTSIVELLAHEINEGNIPRLKNHQIHSLSFTDLMSDTEYRGKFEKKVKLMLESLNEDSILFIDEMHLVMGAGTSNNNEVDFSNLLKPYLTSGKFKVIGATTFDEYREIEKDPAFKRRFHSVKVNPLTKEQTLHILENECSSYESFHQVKIMKENLSLIVELADKYMKDRNFPDKALDILDEVCSYISVLNNNQPLVDIDKLESEMNKLNQMYDLTGDIQAVEATEYISNYKKMLDTSPYITEDDILYIVEKMTSIPVTKISKEEKTSLLKLESNLKSQLIGQDEAVEALAKTIKRAKMRITDTNKPTVLFFTGSTGVGKTEAVKVLTNSLFGSEDAMIRLNMSEYMSSTSITKLIGAAPGYIGYEKEGELTEKVRRNPFSIVLLDEFDKAHPEISKLLLQIFDEGQLTDSKGRNVDFSNTIIIMTANIISSSETTVGFDSVKTETGAIETLKKMYAPEFINRLDKVITFNKLTKAATAKILDSMLNKYQKMIMKNRNINLDFDESAREYLFKKGFSVEYGARPLKRVITDKVEDLVIDFLLTVDDSKQAELTLSITESADNLALA